MSSSNQSRKRKAEEYVIVSSKRAKFLSTYHRQQSFSLPDSMMHYIAKTPQTSNCYAKMVQSCKYFFIKNPILVAKEIISVIENEYLMDAEYINISNLQSKLWITDFLDLDSKYAMSPITEKMFKCEAKTLFLLNVTISFEEFLRIATKVEDVIISKIDMKKNDGSEITFEEIFKSTKAIKKIIYSPVNDKAYTSNTAAELVKCSTFSNVRALWMHNMPQIFNVTEFAKSIKTNNNKAQIILDFNDTCSDEYKKELDRIIDDVIETVPQDYVPMVIKYPGQDAQKLRKLRKICKF